MTPVLDLFSFFGVRFQHVCQFYWIVPGYSSLVWLLYDLVEERRIDGRIYDSRTIA